MKVIEAGPSDTKDQMGWEKMRMEMTDKMECREEARGGPAQDGWNCEGHGALVHSVRQASAVGN